MPDGSFERTPLRGAGLPRATIWTLLAGGALIHPAGVLLCRLLGAPAAHSRANPLGRLAAASTLWLIFCLPLAYGLGLQDPAWFFAAMLLVIGGRYLVFATVYGMRLYWVLGFALSSAGFALGWLSVPALAVVAAGAAVELAFAVAGIVQHRRWVRSDRPIEPTPLCGAA